MTDTSCAQSLQTSALEQTAVFVFYMSLVRLFVSSVQGLETHRPGDLTSSLCNLSGEAVLVPQVTLTQS